MGKADQPSPIDDDANSGRDQFLTNDLILIFFLITIHQASVSKHRQQNSRGAVCRTARSFYSKSAESDAMPVYCRMYIYVHECMHACVCGCAWEQSKQRKRTQPELGPSLATVESESFASLPIVVKNNNNECSPSRLV